MGQKIFMLLFCTLFCGNLFAQSYHTTVPIFTDSELRARLTNMQNEVVPPHFNTVVKSYINTYTVKNREKTEAMLGRISMYFPLIEEHIKAVSLPLDLKYLPIVESALKPHALSRVGAGGMWQFMPYTAKENGLRIDSYVDERKDPHKSTKAALQYLYKQYKRYGDWSLALAAYNGGPGRVNRAIKRGRSKDFWRISKYLPRETRNYVSAFTAASYIVEFYHLHNLSPVYPVSELQYTDRIKVYNRIDFQQIADITGTPLYIIKTLNPSYNLEVLPNNQEGNYLILPNEGMAVFRNFLQRPDSKNYSPISKAIPGLEASEKYVMTNYTVQSGDNIASVANVFSVEEKQIKSWNQLMNSQLRQGQQLKVYLRKYDPTKDKAIEPLDAIPIELKEIERRLEEVRISNLNSRILSKFSVSKKGKKEKFVYYQIKRRETLIDIIAKFPDVNLDEVMELNDLKKNQKLKPGRKIIIKKL